MTHEPFSGNLMQWASDLRLTVAPGAVTGLIADDVQEFIEALVAKAAD